MSVENESDSSELISSVRSLKELIDIVSGRTLQPLEPQRESTIANIPAFPLLAIVGQVEMKTALLLSIINPAIGGVLLVGGRGSGKTTAVRGLVDLLPSITRSACYYGCLPEDIEAGGMDAICPDCAKKYGENIPLVRTDPVHLVELPLNASLEDVVGRVSEGPVAHERLRLRRGILSEADQNILYIDEVNLLRDDIVNVILDAAAQSHYTIRHGTMALTYRSRFTLIGSMNPEEGNLRPQILDRFGLRVFVSGVDSPQDRVKTYERVMAYHTNPTQFAAEFLPETSIARQEVQTAREILPHVRLSPEISAFGVSLIQSMNIKSLRAEITLFESARAYAAADGRDRVTREDIHAVAVMALRLRRSSFMTSYLDQQAQEDDEIQALFKSTP